MRLHKLLPSLAVSLILLAGCGTATQAVPASPAAAQAPASSSVIAAAPSPSTQANASPAPAGTSPRASGAPAATPQRPPLPKQLLIPAIKVDAPVERVGTTASGAMDVPKQWNDVGWFEQGFRPGETGSAVVAGHLDSTNDKAVFWDLHLLKPGDKVMLKREDGSQLTFQVTGSETYPYNQAPLQKIFGPADAPMLNLVTCNGTFDRGAKNYDKRLVVYTKQVAG